MDRAGKEAGTELGWSHGCSGPVEDGKAIVSATSPHI